MIRSEEFHAYLFRRNAVGKSGCVLRAACSVCAQRLPSHSDDEDEDEKDKGATPSQLRTFIDGHRPVMREAARAAWREARSATAPVVLDRLGKISELNVPPLPMNRSTFVDWLKVKGKVRHCRAPARLPFTSPLRVACARNRTPRLAWACKSPRRSLTQHAHSPPTHWWQTRQRKQSTSSQQGGSDAHTTSRNKRGNHASTRLETCLFH